MLKGLPSLLEGGLCSAPMRTNYFIARASAARKWVSCVGFLIMVAAVLWGIAAVVDRETSLVAWMVALASLLVIAVFYFFDRSKHVAFEVENGHLRITGDLFGRRFPLPTLKLERAAILDLTQETDFRPRWRITGTSMPCYRAGEFSLRNGKPAFVFLSDLSRVLCIPLTAGHLILLSCTNAEELLSALILEKDRA